MPGVDLKRRSTLSAAVILLVLTCLQACAPLDKTQNAFGSRRLISEPSFEQIDLPTLIAPALLIVPASSSSAGQFQSSSAAPPDQTLLLAKALDSFYTTFTDEEARKLSRNRIQERLLAASVQRCGVYTQFLKELDTDVGFVLGALTTGLAAVATIVSPSAAATWLAGSAAGVSGINAEFAQRYFQNLTIQVIKKGIGSRRNDIYQAILENRKKPFVDYTLEAAIKDALEYHAACGLITGLEVAAISIDRVDNPGLAEYKKLMTSGNPLGDILVAQGVLRPKPVVGNLVPPNATVGGAAFTLTATGTSFVQGATVLWNGAARTTTFVSATELKAAIPATDLTTASSVTITVVNSLSGGVPSGDVSFTVANLKPVVGNLVPPNATVGGAAFTLTATGTSFVQGATVLWNGIGRTTTFVSATELKAAIPATDLATATSVTITVVNPLSGGAASAGVSFTVAKP